MLLTVAAYLWAIAPLDAVRYEKPGPIRPSHDGVLLAMPLLGLRTPTPRSSHSFSVERSRKSGSCLSPLHKVLVSRARIRGERAACAHPSRYRHVTRER